MTCIVEPNGVGLTWIRREPLQRASHALVDAGRLWLVDPTDEAEAIAQAIELGEPIAVLQLLDRHNRDCAAIAACLNVPLLRTPGSLPDTPFTVVPLVRMRFWREIALWWPSQGTLVVAEAVGTAPAYAPPAGGAGVHPMLRLRPPRPLHYFAPRRLLVGHGRSLHEQGAAEALAQALTRSRRDIPRGLAGLIRAGAQAARSS